METREICGSFCNGFCGLDWEDEEDRPSSCDDQDLCIDDGFNEGCDEFFANDEICDECGEPLGFCASDCPTRDENYEE